MVYAYNEMLHSNTNKGTNEIRNNLDDSYNCFIEHNKPDPKEYYYNILNT